VQEWELYAGQDKEGYVPGQTHIPQPPLRSPSSRQSPRDTAVPRERESRRVAVQQQRRAAQLEEELARTGPHSPPAASWGDPAQLHFLAQGDLAGAQPNGLHKGYRHAAGRESETPLRLSDVQIPLHIPSALAAHEARLQQMAAQQRERAAQDGGEAEAEGPSEVEERAREWEAAARQVAEQRERDGATGQQAAHTRAQKRQAASEARQIVVVEASTSRIGRAKLRKVAKI
jgi:hypothetical protein